MIGLKWYNELINIDYAKGKRENPFLDFNEAAQYMVGEISCMVNNMSHSIKNIKVIVKKTNSTPDNIKDAFSYMLSYYGIQQVLDTGKLLNVLLNAQDQFEMDIYQKDKKEKFDIANVVMAIDGLESDRETYIIKVQLIDIKTGMPIPKCLSKGYVLSNKRGIIVRATGTGFCNKTLNKDTKLTSTFYPIKKNTSAYKQSQAYMIGNVELYLRDQLKKNKISSTITRLISIAGEIGLPDCRKENHYLAPQNILARHYCTLNYDLGIIIQNKNLFQIKGNINGIGSNRNTAWDDALLGISQEIYHFAYQIALRLSEKVTMNSFKQKLIDLDNSSLTIANDFDVDFILDELDQVAKQIKQISDF
ncbi:hypothetical protein MHK_000801 [Candidatus Magnetomorum sp. HK-1]|nr:hypothetical protein MHK_000801 [Candidatus Magnetomorum sp. HK-1]